MRYTFEISDEMDKKEVGSILLNNYKFPLLCFAYVVADIFAEHTVLSKKIRGRSKSEIYDAISILERNKKSLEKKQKFFYSCELEPIIKAFLNVIRHGYFSNFHSISSFGVPHFSFGLGISYNDKPPILLQSQWPPVHTWQHRLHILHIAPDGLQKVARPSNSTHRLGKIPRRRNNRCICLHPR